MELGAAVLPVLTALQVYSTPMIAQFPLWARYLRWMGRQAEGPGRPPTSVDAEPGGWSCSPHQSSFPPQTGSVAAWPAANLHAALLHSANVQLCDRLQHLQNRMKHIRQRERNVGGAEPIVHPD